MKLSYVILVVFLGVVCAKKRYDGYQLLQVFPQNFEHAKLLHKLEEHSLISLQNEITRRGRPVDILVAPNVLANVQTSLLADKIRFRVKNTNLQTMLDVEEARLAKKKVFDIDDFNDVDDIYSQLDVWNALCPSDLTCSVYSIGESFDGQDILAFRIGTGNPVILMDTLIHAREWLTAATTLKIIDNLIVNYGTGRNGTDLLETYDFVFIPVGNPDGYEYSWTDDRLWRKNRRDHDGSQCFGVDLNRNFDTDEFCMQGSSTSECSNLYCGAEGGSEPEVEAQQIEALRLQNEDSGIAAWLTIHSYADMWMFPWGFTDNFRDPPFGTCVRTDDFDDLYFVSEAAQEAILDTSGELWDIGTSCEIIYPTTAATDDWARGKGGVKHIYTLEIRGNSFVVPPSEIQPSYEEVWAATVAAMGAIQQLE